MALNPRESAEYIVKNVKHVKIHYNNIEKLAQTVYKKIKEKIISVDNFSQHELHPSDKDIHAIDWIFLIDTLNFCFWTPGNDTKWKVNGQTGYFALCAAINRAIKEGVDITNPKFYSKISEEELDKILRSDDGIIKVPLLEARVNCLREVGLKLIEKYDGKFENCIKLCNNSAQKLLKLIVDEFPCFRDEAIYCGKQVSFYKRAQILIGDIWSCFRGKNYGEFNDIETITMFADYRVPQVLVHFGTLEYTEELLNFLKTDKLLNAGDEREQEIRGASIYIVEELKKNVWKLFEENGENIEKNIVNSILLDHFLWDYRRKNAKELEFIPFHKVLGIYY
ncbi:queuosine salvage protein [Condylostylus longicornis]|uniref:queuosine salvage protein n=1 Tax=Condylostylus longicornis TaxID=2530218 RepID=UPI00244E22D4|nr:queuosine salvage protein [Condylostylus longicornis]